MNAVLTKNLQWVQQTNIKSFAHLFRKRESDRREIEQALVEIEHDKSNLRLFTLNKFGESVVKVAEMGDVRTLADLDRDWEKAGQDTDQAGQRLGSSSDSQVQVKETPVAVAAAAAPDKRKWKGMKVKGKKASVVCGNRNADGESVRARAEAGDDWEWEDLGVERNKAEAVYGDVNDVKLK